MTEIEEKSIAVKFFINKRDELVEELNLLVENVTLLDSSIHFINSTGNYSEQYPEELIGKTLTSMYVDREKLKMKILEKEYIINHYLEIILDLSDLSKRK